MIISGDELKNISKLAKLEISSKESKKFTLQLGNIFDYIRKIQNYEFLKDIKDENDKPLELRKDIVIESETENLIDQFSDRDKNFLKVKKVL